ncbi:protein GRAVITROPIC IN THE LIGHT 1-like [Bidens hawaiensis]|uniref:protein GRAVITROPIC IN THE LIGHT 1-like n=1 Tax=Bidens hawaiensis TaxID=980011 RepID=UPI004049B8F1
MELHQQQPSSKPPQISDMFQKLAVAFKTKTFEFFTEEDAAVSDNDYDFTLLDDVITDQKVIILKPDSIPNSESQTHSQTQSQSQSINLSDPIIQPFNTHFGNDLISSVFALISSFEASYLQLQTSHVPIDEHNIIINDKALVNLLQKLQDLRGLYIDSRKNPDFKFDLASGSCLEAQVNENQNKLRALEFMFNRLQAEIELKDDKVLIFKNRLRDIEVGNSRLVSKMSENTKPPNSRVLPRIRVFESMLRDACRSAYAFTKILIRLMKSSGFDLVLAASYVHPDVGYTKPGHNRYAFLSYVCLGMFQSFDVDGFGVVGNEGVDDSMELFELFKNESFNALEMLNKSPNLPFSKFCERKYEQLVHPTMESSIFKNLDRKEVMGSWRSVRAFYDAFVNMSSSIWLLHKLGRSFTPPVEIFQVEKGVDFSMVYMEDVRKKDTVFENGMSKVAFTVVPGFKIGRTVIQSQVYLTGSKSTK